MEQLKSMYETVFIVNNTIGEEAVKAVVEKFTKLITDNGEIESVNEWGVRKLAYPIQDLNEGYYVLVKFSAPHEFPAVQHQRLDTAFARHQMRAITNGRN